MFISISEEDVIERLSFAERRMSDLFKLNDGDLAGADASYRQQLIQEFFFHLAGAIELLAQLVNEKRGLAVNPEIVSIPNIVEKLPGDDPIKQLLNSLYIRTRGKEIPDDPYSEAGYIFRIHNYRNQVTHRWRSPVFIIAYVGGQHTRSVSLMLDPRDKNKGPSNKTVQEELIVMFDLVSSKCQQHIEFLI